MKVLSLAVNDDTRKVATMPDSLFVWIDQDKCTGDGLCTEIEPNVFTMGNDGLAYVKDGDVIFDGSDADHPAGGRGLARVREDQVESCIEAAEECPGECIYFDTGRD